MAGAHNRTKTHWEKGDTDHIYTQEGHEKELETNRNQGRKWGR